MYFLLVYISENRNDIILEKCSADVSKRQNFSIALIPGGPGIPPLHHGHRDAGGDLERDQEALLCALVQGGRELHRGGLGHREGGLKAEGNCQQLYNVSEE